MYMYLYMYMYICMYTCTCCTHAPHKGHWQLPPSQSQQNATPCHHLVYIVNYSYQYRTHACVLCQYMYMYMYMYVRCVTVQHTTANATIIAIALPHGLFYDCYIKAWSPVVFSTVVWSSGIPIFISTGLD